MAIDIQQYDEITNCWFPKKLDYVNFSSYVTADVPEYFIDS